MSHENRTPAGEKAGVPKRIFAPASADAKTARETVATPQTEDPSYRLAFQDDEFLLREDLRPVRFQLELLKTQLTLDEADIGSTFVMYGSARIPEPDRVPIMMAAAKTPEQQAVAEKLASNAKYYDEARQLARLASQVGRDAEGKKQFVVCSGGGPSIMEAANRGARDVGADTIGLNIVLPHEQAPNPYVTPHLSLRFHYFALRKMHFLLHARAVAVFPGGFGTFDEFFELLTLVQTGKTRPLPILLFGREFWETVVNWQALADYGVISAKDLDLFRYVDTAEEAWDVVREWYGMDASA
ncbi:LOG family protein [Sphingomonas abietis]|uniref:Cytokinin riboside 5'-monophosphate phosphoribohydrolase n=1 Tax=Sphingomonas abietis TaxID=3012344 RepID=A0ABY7NNH1_9SPHN|nr:TIGR00730 family Rossman fold protein [Sphingomonas abietis]WBO23081.1 TIGR00730 family Rossman fold protein [Sphingomonas abietis]